MISIYDKLWFILQGDKNSEGTLAYMCQYEETKAGEPTSSTVTKQRTGRRWSQFTEKAKEDYLGEIVENKPLGGFYVGNSVSRWSTSNKLFRVEDPRGFTVEIPTDNLATLLHHTTVVKGFVQEECVWGREGGNHILLPVNSEPYKLAMKDIETLEEKLIPVSELKVGDWVKFFKDNNNEYYFCGRVKITWKVRGHKPRMRAFWGDKGSEETFSEWFNIKDSKYVNLFIRRASTKDEIWYAETPTKPNIVEVLRNEKMEIDFKKFGWFVAPDRVSKQIWELVDTRPYSRVQSEILSIEHKG